MTNKLYTQAELDTLLKAAQAAALREPIAKFREYADTKTMNGMKICDARKQAQYELMMAGQCLAYATAAKHLESLISPTTSLALERHDAELRAEAAAVMEKFCEHHSLPLNEKGEHWYREPGEAMVYLPCAIPTTYADALERLLAKAHEDGYKMKGEIALARQERLIAKEREDEHAKLCPMCSIFPSEKSGCIRLAELRRAAVKEHPNAKEE